MIGITLSFGGLVTVAAVGEYTASAGSASLGSALQVSSSGVQVSFVYAFTASPGSCPTYDGAPEGTSLTVAIYDYGTSSFAPVLLADNSTLFTGNFAQLSPGTLQTYTLSESVCVHASGQTVALAGSTGKEVEVGT